MRMFLSAAALFMFLVGAAMAQNPSQHATQQTDHNAKVQHKGRVHHAKIVNINPTKGTVTLQFKGKSGKSRVRTFHLTEDIQYADSTGRVARVDLFRSGDEVLVVEEKGHLKQLSQAPHHEKGSHPATQPGGISKHTK